jgi:hypothetical protein
VSCSRCAFILAVLCLRAQQALATQAQPVPIPEDQSTAPQIDIAGVGIATVGVGRSAETGKAEGALNFSDSAIQVGASQRLYDQGGIGSVVFGGVTTEESNQGTGASLFLHQAFTNYQTERFEALVGRSDNPTAHLVDFPTLRGDDLVTLTNPLNPYSDGGNEEEHRYSNVASVTLNQGLRFFENFHAQHLVNSAGVGTESGINSFGVTLEVLGAPGLEMFGRIPSWGIGYEHLALDARSPGGLHQVFAGGVINLSESVTDRWDLRFQEIVSLGSELTSFDGITDSFQADSNVATAAIRYLHSPFGRPGYQLSLTGGFKNYFKIAEARSAGLALTAVKRLGEGFDLISQYQGQWRQRVLAEVQSHGVAYEQVAEVGLVFNFDSIFNQHLSPRRSILNQQHQYVPN